MLDVQRVGGDQADARGRGAFDPRDRSPHGHDRNTIRRALRRQGPPVYERPPRPSKLDPHKPRIHELLADDPKIPSAVIRERIGERRAIAAARRSSTTTCASCGRSSPRRAPTSAPIYRPGEICQFDIWRAAGAEIPVGHGQTRRGYVVVACMGYSRAGAGALVFSKQAADVTLGDVPLPALARRAAEDAGLGSRGRALQADGAPDR